MIFAFVSFFNLANVRFTNSIHFGQFSKRQSRGSNFFNIFLGQLRWFVTTFCSVLCLAVFTIVRRCSKKKMPWINAQRIVAAMTNKIAIFNLAMMHFIRQPMCVTSFFCRRSAINSIATVGGPNPVPTSRKWNECYFVKKLLSGHAPFCSSEVSLCPLR